MLSCLRHEGRKAAICQAGYSFQIGWACTNGYCTAEENYRGHHSGSISTTRDGKQYEIYLRNDEIIALYIDDKRIPDGKISDYKQAVAQINKGKKKKSPLPPGKKRPAMREGSAGCQERSWYGQRLVIVAWFAIRDPIYHRYKVQWFIVS